MKKIILLSAFAFLTACSSEEWSPVLVEDEPVESSSDAVELSSSSVEPVIESSSEIDVESFSSSSVELPPFPRSSSSYEDETVCTTEECVAKFCHEIYEEYEYNCDVAIAHGCEKYLHDECWE